MEQAKKKGVRFICYISIILFHTYYFTNLHLACNQGKIPLNHLNTLF